MKIVFYNSVIYIWGGFPNKTLKDILLFYIFWLDQTIRDKILFCIKEIKMLNDFNLTFIILLLGRWFFFSFYAFRMKHKNIECICKTGDIMIWKERIEYHHKQNKIEIKVFLILKYLLLIYYCPNYFYRQKTLTFMFRNFNHKKCLFMIIMVEMTPVKHMISIL